MLPDLDPRRRRTLLIIADDAELRRVVSQALVREVNRVLEAATSREGIDLAAAAQPDLVILGVCPPDPAGVLVCREIRKWSSVPILVLSARQAEDDNVRLLDAGADDFVTRPFGTAELRARVRANLRRAEAAAAGAGGAAPPGPLVIGELALDLTGRTLRRGGAAVHLTPIEWELLRVLVTHAGRTLTHPQLFAALWGPEGEVPRQQHLRVHLANLRRKLEPGAIRPRLIVTEPGVGYRFEMPE
jgi:two-component system KDP operon response regulator KdpE